MLFLRSVHQAICFLACRYLSLHIIVWRNDVQEILDGAEIKVDAKRICWQSNQKKYYKKLQDTITLCTFCTHETLDGQIVVLFNGFQKKTQKTPANEIEKAIKIKDAYYADKQSQNR